MHIDVRDWLHPGRRVVPDSTLRVFVGRDLFYFADTTSRDRFLKEPLRFCKMLTDPVDRTRFKPTSKSPRMEYGDRLFVFASDSTIATFKNSPAPYVLGQVRR